MAVTDPPRPRLPRRRRSAAGLALAAAAAALTVALAPVALLALVLGGASGGPRCTRGGGPTGRGISLLPPGAGGQVGATEYGGPGDPSSGQVGSSGVDLATHPDSYAELGGTTFQTATALGGLAYETPLRVTWGDRSVIAYKRDIGLGGGPIDGRSRQIDLWWELAGALGIPYEDGEWSGVVRLQRPPATGAGNVLGESVAAIVPGTAASATGSGGPAFGSGASVSASAGSATDASPACDSPRGIPTPTPITSGPRARLLPDGQAAAPAAAPAAVKGIIAAGNQIVGKPYLYGGGHGTPLNEIAPFYDCSSSVEHLLWGGGLLPVDYDADSGTLASFGAPGPGRWVTIYASSGHVFMYVAGLRWDTHNAAGPQDGSAGIGWHPLIRESSGFVVRHPVGL